MVLFVTTVNYISERWLLVKNNLIFVSWIALKLINNFSHISWISLVFTHKLYFIDAMRRDTAAPSVFGLGVFVLSFGMWRLAVYAWRSFGWSCLILFGICRFWQILAELGSFLAEPCLSAGSLIFSFAKIYFKREPKQQRIHRPKLQNNGEPGHSSQSDTSNDPICN